jgi:hypothetical protein
MMLAWKNCQVDSRMPVEVKADDDVLPQFADKTFGHVLKARHAPTYETAQNMGACGRNGWRFGGSREAR